MRARSSGYSISTAVARTERPARLEAPVAAFTVDVEDWYQSCIDADAPITERVVRNVERVLSVLDEYSVKGTFFVQGRVAERFPGLVRDLVEQGHEIQSHGYSHRPLFRMDSAALREEVVAARASVEDASGTRVTAFRAQDFSIKEENLWALEMLAEAGFEIDSSIFPMRSRGYGIRDWEVAPHYLELASGASLLEVPVAVWATRVARLPVAGGGYFRLLPMSVLKRGLRAIVKSGRPVVVYCHPYEFNSTELSEYRSLAPRGYLFAQGAGRTSFPDRVRSLLASMRFGRFDEVLRAWRVI
jgi:polysaccharide deacetylase family protein (PEP-CTERM system associated)